MSSCEKQMSVLTSCVKSRSRIKVFDVEKNLIPNTGSGPQNERTRFPNCVRVLMTIDMHIVSITINNRKYYNKSKVI